MFERLRSRHVEDFATELARDFSKRCPPNAGVRSTMGLARAIDDICNRAAEFQRAKRLGLYGKAKLGTEFKMLLKESGYPPEFIDELTTKLLMHMSGK